MSCPGSFDVSDGMPTSFQQYNNLRADALRFGNGESDAVNVGQMFSRYEDGLTLEVLDGDRVRVPASGGQPVGLVIGGVPLLATLNVDLPLGSRPNGGAGMYYVFAVRSPGSATFTLDLNTAAAESSNRRLVGRFYWDGSQVAPGSLVTERGLNLQALARLDCPQAADGRLSLAPGRSFGDVSSADQVYYTPHAGNRLALYAPGYGWWLQRFEELAIPLSGKTGGKNLDVFLYFDRAALRAELTQWAGDNARGYALPRQDGVLVKSGEPWKRYVGTLRTYAPGLTCDTPEKRLVWNWYHRLPRQLFLGKPVGSWVYTEAIWRQANNEDSRLELVAGDTDAFLDLSLTVTAGCANGAFAQVAIAEDNAALPMVADMLGQFVSHSINSTGALSQRATTRAVKTLAVAGSHVYFWLERVIGTSATFFGTDANRGLSGMIGYVLG